MVQSRQMSLPTLHFLGWDAPLVDVVAAWLLRDRARLPASLVVVPTSHSGRRLRQHLALAAGGAVLSPHVCTPDALFRVDHGAATDAMVRAAWVEAMLAAPADLLAPFLPEEGGGEPDAIWALGLLDSILPTLSLLTEVGLRPADVPARCPAAAADAARWTAMDDLSRAVGNRLGSLGLDHPDAAKFNRARHPILPTGVRHLVVACVPDPVPMARQAMDAILSSGVATVDVLVHAPDDVSGLFNAWGRPDSEAWAAALLPLPRGNDTILVVRDAAEAAEQAVRACADLPSSDLALGAPDPSLVPALSRAFAAAGWPVFDPDSQAAGTTGLRIWIHAWLDGVDDTTVRYDPISRALRTKSAWAWLGRGEDAAGFFRLTTALDRLQQECLPETLGDARRAAESWARGHGGHVKNFDKMLIGNELSDIFMRLADMLERARSGDISTAWEQMIDALAAAGHADGANGKLLDAMASAGESLAQLEADFSGLGRGAILAIWRRGLPDVARPDDGSESVADVMGWLELPYESGRHLIVAGMHDGMVPDNQRDDALLPDSQRALLGLPDRAMRAARDAFLWRGMVASRATAGSIIVITTKFDGKGEPRKPSSLLLRCLPEDLPARVQHCFAEKPAQTGPRPPNHRSHWRLDFPLDPAAAAALADHITPTLIRDYLACPFAFYLKNVLGMDRFEADARELDPRQLGTLFHQVLEDFGGDPGIKDSTDGKAIVDYLLGRLDELVARRFGSSLSLPLMVQTSSIKERLTAFAYQQAAEAAKGWEIQKVEWRVGKPGAPEWRLADRQVFMTIDRIDFHLGERRWRVLDYKTGAVKNGPEDEHLENMRPGLPQLGGLMPKASARARCERRWKNVQLPLYAAWLRQTGGAALGMMDGDTIEVGYIALPRNIGAVGFSMWGGYDAATEASALEWSEEAVRRICNGVFGPPVTDNHGVPKGDWKFLAPDGWEAALAPGVLTAFAGKEVAV